MCWVCVLFLCFEFSGVLGVCMYWVSILDECVGSVCVR